MAAVHTSLCAALQTQTLCLDRLRRDSPFSLSSHNSRTYGKRIARLSAQRRCPAVPLSGLVRCIFLESNARFQCALRDQEGPWGRGRVRRSRISAQSSSSSSSSQSTSQSEDAWEGFNPDDYEQAEETEEEARRRNWVERGYEFIPF